MGLGFHRLRHLQQGMRRLLLWVLRGKETSRHQLDIVFHIQEYSSVPMPVVSWGDGLEQDLGKADSRGRDQSQSRDQGFVGGDP